MTDSKYMNRNELLKLAALDVFGLLEAYEAEMFQRSLLHATANIQDEIVRLQAEFASDMTLHTTEEPDPGLRERVLERVALAVEEEAEKLAPIASFRSRQPGQASNLHNRLEGDRQDRTTKIWRGLSFALAACLAISGVVIVMISQTSMNMSALALDLTAHQELKDALGFDFKIFVESPNVQVVTLKPEGEDNRAFGQVYINPVSSKVFVLALDLPRGDGYTVHAITDEGDEIMSAQFDSNGVAATVLKHDARTDQLLAGVIWEVRDPGGSVVLRA